MKDRIFPKKRSWREALFLELIRKAVLESFRYDENRPFRSEDEAFLYSLWTLVNPIGVKGRESCEVRFSASREPPIPGYPPLPPRIRTLTMHPHPDEPLTPSPEDLILYDRLDVERGASVHFIADELQSRKIT